MEKRNKIRKEASVVEGPALTPVLMNVVFIQMIEKLNGEFSIKL